MKVFSELRKRKRERMNEWKKPSSQFRCFLSIFPIFARILKKILKYTPKKTPSMTASSGQRNKKSMNILRQNANRKPIEKPWKPKKKNNPTPLEMKTYDRPIVPDYFCDLRPSCGKFNDHKDYVAKFSGFKESCFYKKKCKENKKVCKYRCNPWITLLPSRSAWIYHLLKNRNWITE